MRTSKGEMSRVAQARARAAGYRSGLEVQIGQQLKEAGIEAGYETVVMRYKKPAREARYTPDFVLPNGIIIETKGRWTTADRQKHKLIAEQYPDVSLRFVFSNSNNRISKQSKTTYADYCRHNGWLFADKYIPESWLREKPNKRSLAVIARLLKEKRT